MNWRVRVLTIAGLCLGFGGSASEQSLREAASSSGILIGTAVRPTHPSEAAYAPTLARESNMVEPEDALQWE
ncbi:MAG: hypothetical protein WCB11_19405 [Terriglobales bacterium]